MLSKLENKKHLLMTDLRASELWGNLEPLLNSGISNARQLLFHYVNNISEIPKCKCGKQLGWHPDKREYRKYCSKKCTAFYSVAKIKENNLNKFGVEWHTQLPTWSEKVKNTSLEKFGTNHYSQTQEFLDRVIATNLENFGVEYPSQNKEIQEKTKQTCQEKYRVNSPLASTKVRNKGKETNLKKFGCENPMSNKEVQCVLKQSNLRKYQVEYPMQNPVVAAKTSQTNKKNYYSPTTFEKINDPQWLKYQNSLSTVGEVARKLTGITQSALCKYYHNHNVDIIRHATTELERKFLTYFSNKNINIEIKNRKIISPKEIDVYFPDYKLGIEINGGYWHSEQFRSDSEQFRSDINEHLNKTILASQAGVELWHFWDCGQFVFTFVKEEN